MFPAWIKGKVLLTAFLRDLTERKRAEHVAVASARLHAGPGRRRVPRGGASASLSPGRGRDERLLGRDLAPRGGPAPSPGGREVAGRRSPRRCSSAAALVPSKVEREGPRLRVPMRAASRNVGCLEVTTHTSSPQNAEWLLALEELGSQIGLFVERHWAEEALRQGQAGMAAVADAIPGAVYQYEVRPDGKESFTFMSRGAVELFGVDNARLQRGGLGPLAARGTRARGAPPPVHRGLGREPLPLGSHASRCGPRPGSSGSTASPCPAGCRTAASSGTASSWT